MKTALLVIDVQNIYCKKEYDYYCEDSSIVISNINKIIKTFKKNELCTLYVFHKHKADGSDAGRMFDFAGENDELEFVEGTDAVKVPASLDYTSDDITFIKNRYDAFEGTNLYDYLEKNNIGKVIITGFMTNFCCESTARVAHSKNFYVDFVTDATSTPGTEELSPDDTKKATFATLSSGFACLKTADEIVEALA